MLNVGGLLNTTRLERIGISYEHINGPPERFDYWRKPGILRLP